MAEIEKPIPQSSSNKPQSNIRRSQRPKTPSQLYADNFEDTQKLIYPSPSQTVQTGKRPNPKTSQKKNNSELTSLIEKDNDAKSDEETALGANLESESGSDPNEEEYLPFIYPPGSRSGPDGNSVKYVSFKCLVVDEGESVGGAGNVGSQVYSTRKIRKKPAYHDDYTFSTDARKLKVKPKTVPKKSNKTSSKAAKPSGNQDFLDVILSAALKAQAKQTGGDSITNPKSPGMSDESSDNNGNNGPDLKRVQSTGKASANKFSVFDDKENMRKKLSIKKELSTRSSINEIDLNQRKAEYQDHYISMVTKKDDKIVLNHTKNHPIVMKYHQKKFPVKSREMLNSKIFELPFKEEFSLLSGTSGDADGEWKKKLKIKENIMALHFKEVLQNYKPGILI